MSLSSELATTKNNKSHGLPAVARVPDIAYWIAGVGLQTTPHHGCLWLSLQQSRPYRACGRSTKCQLSKPQPIDLTPDEHRVSLSTALRRAASTQALYRAHYSAGRYINSSATNGGIPEDLTPCV